MLACGNPSRGDDALGPLLLERLQHRLDAEGLAGGFELIGDFPLNIEHALDLAGRRLVLFIDAGSGTLAPFVFREVVASDAPTHSTHALPPEAVLAVLPRVSSAAPPSAFVLCVRGERFELGEGLSDAATFNAERALDLLKRLCQSPDVALFQAAARAP